MTKTILLSLFPILLSAQAGQTQPAVAPQNTTSESLAIAKTWQEGDPLPSPGENGTVVFQYGAAMPPIVCSPERLTTILLEPGEKVNTQPVLGDSARWLYVTAVTGEGENARVSIVIKPRRPLITTDLFVATDRRAYQLLLTSTPTEHLSVIEFTYPVDEAREWKRLQSAQQKLTAEEAHRKSTTVAELSGPANYGYSLEFAKKAPPPFVPKAVYDDGKQTSLKMPAAAQNWSTAILETAGPNGCEIVNYRVVKDPVGETWVIDRLFDNARLISGTGKQAQRVIIRRDGAPQMKCDSIRGKKTEVAKTQDPKKKEGKAN